MTRTPSPRRNAVLATLVALVLGAAGTALADAAVLVLDPEATHIEFDVQATGHDVHGAFALNEGTVRFDPATGAASGRIAVDATAAQTGNGSRDKTLHGKVLESVRFPLFVFEPERFEGELPEQGRGEVILVGTLTIHGTEHPFTLPAEVERTGDAVQATAHFDVPYVEWGMHNPSLLFLRVADEVAVTVEAAGSLESAAGAPAAAVR